MVYTHVGQTSIYVRACFVRYQKRWKQITRRARTNSNRLVDRILTMFKTLTWQDCHVNIPTDHLLNIEGRVSEAVFPAFWRFCFSARAQRAKVTSPGWRDNYVAGENA